MGGSINIEDVPKDLQELLLAQSSPVKKSQKSPEPGLKERKVKASAEVLFLLSGFTLPQQRMILTFCIEVIEKANKKYWRDGAEK